MKFYGKISLNYQGIIKRVKKNLLETGRRLKDTNAVKAFE